MSTLPRVQGVPGLPVHQEERPGRRQCRRILDRSTLKSYTTDDCELLQPDVEFGAQDYGVATKKGSDLSKTVDDTVKKLKKDGWLDEEIQVGPALT